MSSFLAVFLTVLVTRPQHSPDTQAGLLQPWVGVASGSHTQQIMSVGGPERQETGRQPELWSIRDNVPAVLLLVIMDYQSMTAAHGMHRALPHVGGDPL